MEVTTSNEKPVNLICEAALKKEVSKGFHSYFSQIK